VIGVIFDDIIVDASALRTPFWSSFDIYVGHPFISRYSYSCYSRLVLAMLNLR
jgi:hypothetical protein